MSFETVQIGHCTMILGDCRDVLPTVPDKSVDLVVTSPPYNLKKKWWDSGANGIHTDLADKFANDWYDDEIPEDEYQKQQRFVLEQCHRISRGSVCYNHKVRHAFKREGRTFHPIEWTGGAELWCEIIWDRGPGPAVNCRRPVMADERIFVFHRPISWNDLGYTSIWKFAANREKSNHPCPFPVELPSRLIRSFSDPEATVCDPYLGHGTTAVACIRTDRRFIGCEVNRSYFLEACERVRLEWQAKRSEIPFEKPAPRVQQSLLDAG